MGGCLVLENLVLMHWCERMGLGPLGVTGLSMGGHMASLAATNWPKPLVLVPCLSWSTASAVFTEGVMSQSINWERLEMEYYSNGNYRERLAKMVTVVDDAFMAGQQFIQNFNESMHELREDIKTMNKVSKDIDVDASKAIQQQQKIDEIYTKKCVHANGDRKNEKNNTDLIPIVEKPTNLSTTEYVGDTIRVASIALASALNSGTTKLMSLIMPQQEANKKSDNNQLTPIDITKVKWWEREALQFMRGMMDECTHLKNFSIPRDTSLITAVCAKEDAYVPRDGCSSLEDIWPGANVKYLDAGHVSAYVLHQKLFRSSIIENFERAKELYAKGGNNIQPDVELPNIKYDELIHQYNVHCQNVSKSTKSIERAS